MDLKTNILNYAPEVSDELLPEIDGLYFGSLGKDKTVFDYTEYISRNKLENIDYKAFMRQNIRYIKALSEASDVPLTELFYQSQNGHILISQELVFACLAFVNPGLFVYFNSLVADAIFSGVAYSNSFVYDLAANRLPSDVMNEIITERKDATAGEQ